MTSKSFSSAPVEAPAGPAGGDASPDPASGTQLRTFRGRTLAEIADQVRAELGPDAMIVRQREGLMGGVGGFFQKRCFEVDAAPAGAVVDASAEEEAADPEPAPTGDADRRPRFLEQLDAAQAAAEAALAERAGRRGEDSADEPLAEDRFDPSGSSFASAGATRPDAPVSPALQGDGDLGAAAPATEEPAAFVRQAFPRSAPDGVLPAIARENAAALAALFAPDGPRPAGERAEVVEWQPQPPSQDGAATQPSEAVALEPAVVVAPPPSEAVVSEPAVVVAPPSSEAVASEPAQAVAPPPPEPVASEPAPAAHVPQPLSSSPATTPGAQPLPRATPVPVGAATVWPQEAAPVHEALVARGVSPVLAGDLLDRTVTHLLPFSSPAQLKPLVAEALARRIPVQPLCGPGGRVVGFVGAGGAGKTRCVAGLAHTYAERTRMPVACVTLRPKDGGAELAQLLAPYGVPVHAHDDPAEVRERLEALRPDALVVLDTPGVSPRAQAELRVLAAELRQLGLDECHLAVPATIRAEAGRELVRATRKRLGVRALALTHADETDQIGTVVDLAIESELPLSYVGRGPRITAGLQPAVADELAGALLA